MDFLVRLFSEIGECGATRRTAFLAVTIALSAGVLASQGAAAAAGESSSGIVAKYAVTGYPIGPQHPTGVCHPAAPQNVSCDSFLIVLALKRPATSVVVSFDGLSGKLKRVKVKPGATWPSSGVPLSTGTFFTGEIPTVSLLRSMKANHGSGAFPAVGKPGYGTFHVRITLSDGSRIATDLRAYLQRGWH